MKSPIVISPPETDHYDEVGHVKALLSEGLEFFHVRKPGAGAEELQMYLDDFTPDETRRMVLHSHHDLYPEYPLRGLHGPGVNRFFHHGGPGSDVMDFVFPGIGGGGLGAFAPGAPGSSFHEPGTPEFTGTRSCSTHSWEAFAALQDGFDYAFLGPVFPSLSKPGYGPEDPESWEWKLIEKIFVQHGAKCIALGGVTEKELNSIRQWGFDGFAALGFIWNDKGGDPVSQYRLLEKTWNQVLTN